MRQNRRVSRRPASATEPTTAPTTPSRTRAGGRRTTRAPAAKKRSPRASADDAPELGGRFDFTTDSLGYTLRLAQVRMYGLFFEMLGDLGLTPARITALSIIATEPDINQTRLARRLDIAGPSAMKIVDALEEAGLIRRLDVTGDRRRYALALTPSGRSRLETLAQRLAAYEERIAADLLPAEREQLIALLNRTALPG